MGRTVSRSSGVVKIAKATDAARSAGGRAWYACKTVSTTNAWAREGALSIDDRRGPFSASASRSSGSCACPGGLESYDLLGGLEKSDFLIWKRGWENFVARSDGGRC